jgi:hypothetical protein
MSISAPLRDLLVTFGSCESREKANPNPNRLIAIEWCGGFRCRRMMNTDDVSVAAPSGDVKAPDHLNRPRKMQSESRWN